MNPDREITPVITTELLAETLYCACRKTHLPEAALSAITDLAVKGNLNAAFSIAYYSNQNRVSLETNLIMSMICNACSKGNPYAKYVLGYCLVHGGDVEEGLNLLIEADEEGVSEALWEITQHYVRHNDPRALEYVKLAASCDYEHAVNSVSFAADFGRIAFMSLHENFETKIRSTEIERNRLCAELTSLKSLFETENKKLKHNMSLLEIRCREAEGKIVAMNVEAIRYETIAQQQARISQLENELLESQCQNEELQEKIRKQESEIDDLNRNYRHLASLLRKNNIPFIERH